MTKLIDSGNNQLKFAQTTTIEMEERILGTILIDSEAMHSVAKIIKPAMFLSNIHQLIYTVMFSMYEKSIPIDLSTLTDACRKANILEKVGAPSCFIEFTNRVASSANLEHHIIILLESWAKRETLKICHQGMNKAMGFPTDALELIPSVILKLTNISDKLQKTHSRGLLTIGLNLIKQIETNKSKEVLPLFNLKVIDDAIDGAEKGDLIIIGGRPGMGKSSLINTILKASVENNTPTYFMSLEMTPEETLLRMTAAFTGIDGRRIKRGQLSEEEFFLVQEKLNWITEAPIIMGESTGSSVLDFRAKIISLQRTHKIEIAILDRIGLLEFINPKGNTLEEVKRITKLLRRTANELNVTIVAINQLSRAVEHRGGNKRPQLSDLRDSGSLEQDAKKVIFVYRPEYYDILEDEDGNSLKGIGILSVAKNTNGALGEFPYRFDAKTTQFKELEIENWTD